LGGPKRSSKVKPFPELPPSEPVTDPSVTEEETEAGKADHKAWYLSGTDGNPHGPAPESNPFDQSDVYWEFILSPYWTYLDREIPGAPTGRQFTQWDVRAGNGLAAYLVAFCLRSNSDENLVEETVTRLKQVLADPERTPPERSQILLGVLGRLRYASPRDGNQVTDVALAVAQWLAEAPERMLVIDRDGLRALELALRSLTSDEAATARKAVSDHLASRPLGYRAIEVFGRPIVTIEGEGVKDKSLDGAWAEIARMLESGNRHELTMALSGLKVFIAPLGEPLGWQEGVFKTSPTEIYDDKVEVDETSDGQAVGLHGFANADLPFGELEAIPGSINYFTIHEEGLVDLEHWDIPEGHKDALQKLDPYPQYWSLRHEVANQILQLYVDPIMPNALAALLTDEPQSITHPSTPAVLDPFSRGGEVLQQVFGERLAASEAFANGTATEEMKALYPRGDPFMGENSKKSFSYWFADAVAAFFSKPGESNLPDRAWLKKHDPRLYNFLVELFPDA
jgi:hypothetical protein